ncbi:hypothetical protein NL64_06315 [Pseudomonas fluorescens]|uniref:hypothetical protein n=1 Tax=Pseudomonas fluorescens TaxID=294 RepID=UPI00054AFD79|nr:hypothetical protein [Pseudomonas fluorescens]KII34872.1 hypothetical protein NL64_06315 [Pseudomonas fluorescens]
MQTLKPELLAIVDTMSAHLAQQRARAYADGCKYRDNDGRMCAVGCLIPDELYAREIEGGITTMFHSVDMEYASTHRPPVVSHLCSLAPSLERNSLKLFLDRTQIFHDEDHGIDKNSYVGILNAAPPDISNDDLAAVIKTELVRRLSTSPLDTWLE